MTNCKSQEHLGPIEDGGYEVCLEPRFDTHKPCLVYSFGSVATYAECPYYFAFIGQSENKIKTVKNFELIF